MGARGVSGGLFPVPALSSFSKYQSPASQGTDWINRYRNMHHFRVLVVFLIGGISVDSVRLRRIIGDGSDLISLGASDRLYGSLVTRSGGSGHLYPSIRDVVEGKADLYKCLCY